MSGETTRRARSGLGRAGRRLWRDVTGGFELRPDELVALEQACRSVDELVRLEAALASAPTLTVGSAGQTVVHPLFAAVAAHRKVVGHLLDAVGLAVVDQPVLTPSQTGRALARARWSGSRGA